MGSSCVFGRCLHLDSCSTPVVTRIPGDKGFHIWGAFDQVENQRVQIGHLVLLHPGERLRDQLSPKEGLSIQPDGSRIEKGQAIAIL